MLEEIIALIREQLKLRDDVEITPDTRIMEDLGADSLDILQLLMTLEERQGVIIPDEELAKFAVIRDIADYLESLK